MLFRFYISVLLATGLILHSMSFVADLSFADGINLSNNKKLTLQIVGKIKDVGVIEGGKVKFPLSHWWVDVVVEDILVNENDTVINKNDVVKLLVHSIFDTFGEEKDKLIGKSYRFIYYDQFYPVYAGDLKILNPEGTKDVWGLPVK